jgi:hypothetical protein
MAAGKDVFSPSAHCEFSFFFLLGVEVWVLGVEVLRFG